MAQDRPHLDLEGLVKTLRYVTAAVQILPFVYTVLYLVALGIALFASENGPEVLDSIVHEIIHICQHIAQEDGINPFGERMAYLGGDISREVGDIVCELSCPRCSGR